METFKRKKRLLLFIAFALIGVMSTFGQTERTLDFNALLSNFADPPSEYRTAPFMVWNYKVTKSDIARMIDEYKSQGSGAIIIHPRPGLITEYLSDEWFDLYAYAIEKAKEKGMTVWIYDENSYPSGFGGGHVPADMPESFNQGQGLKLEKVMLLPEDIDSYFLCLRKEEDKWIDITGDKASYKGETGDYYLYKKTYYSNSDWYGGYSYVDLMIPGVTEKFNAVTMDGYQKRFGQEFGRSILGVFTDEPEIPSSGGIRWTPLLFDTFKTQWGYDLKTLLPLLDEEIGDWKRVRHDYFSTLLSLFIKHWSKPYHDYCEKHNLKWTGHYWEHDWPNIDSGPDNMAMYEWHQMPAIDMLFNQLNEDSLQGQFGNIRSVKELGSVANQKGFKRVLSETYGGGGWDESLRDFKRLGDWEYVLGVNFMNQHLSHMTLTGARKYDYPPEFSSVSPWWNDYYVVNDYFGRLSMLLSNGIQKNKILVIEPTTTIWCHYSVNNCSSIIWDIGVAFQRFVTKLEMAQVEYDLGSEAIIRGNGSVMNGTLKVGEASYTTVVLPPMMESVDVSTFWLLKDFVAQGGQLIAFSQPKEVGGKASSELSSLLDEPSVIHLTELEPDVVRRYLSDKDFGISYHNGDLYHQRREYKGGELVFMVNSSLDQPTRGIIRMKGTALLKLDALEGKVYGYPSHVSDRGLEASFEIEPCGSLILYVSHKPLEKEYPTEVKFERGTKLEASFPVKVTRLQDDVLPIDFCNLSLKGKDYRNIYFYKAADLAYKAYGFRSGNPWNHSIQYKRNVMDKDTVRSGGFVTTYHFNVVGAADFENIQLVIENSGLFTVKMNGMEIKSIPGTWWLDRHFGVYDIQKSVRSGMNDVEVSINSMSVYAEIEQIYVVGDFSVIPGSDRWSISQVVPTFGLGSWKDQKLPFYSWGMSYSKSYRVDKGNVHYFIQLNKWNGTATEVFVNGEKAGVIFKEPNNLNITPYLKSGENMIDVHVIGSLYNLYGPHYNNPSKGLASPWNWRNVEKPIDPSAYNFIDYGLMEDFDVYSD